MKKSVIAVIAGLASAAAFAGMGNIVVSFSTIGPDKYADGTTVRDGEVYALVWTPSGSEFAGINADGTAAGDSQVVMKAAKAKNGKCPFIAFQIPEEAASDYPGGTWGVYLLDTRKYAADEYGVIDTTSEPTVGDASVVNGYGAVTTFNNAAMANGSGSAAANAATVSTVPALGQDLKVTNISFDGDNVVLEVTGSLSCLRYGLKSGSDVNSLEEGDKIQYGKDNGKMTIYAPKKSGAQFFQVNRK